MNDRAFALRAREGLERFSDFLYGTLPQPAVALGVPEKRRAGVPEIRENAEIIQAYLPADLPDAMELINQHVGSDGEDIACGPR